MVHFHANPSHIPVFHSVNEAIKTELTTKKALICMGRLKAFLIPRPKKCKWGDESCQRLLYPPTFSKSFLVITFIPFPFLMFCLPFSFSLPRQFRRKPFGFFSRSIPPHLISYREYWILPLYFFRFPFLIPKTLKILTWKPLFVSHWLLFDSLTQRYCDEPPGKTLVRFPSHLFTLFPSFPFFPIPFLSGV